MSKVGHVEKLMDYVHSVGDSRAFLRKVGISRRNWRIFLRRYGLDDGTPWSLARLAEDGNSGQTCFPNILLMEDGLHPLGG